MRQHSARFARVAASGDQVHQCRADLYFGGQLLATDLKIADGEIDYDADKAVMASGSITLAEPGRAPSASGFGTLAPYGYELALYGGLVFADGTPELLPLGVFPLQKSAFEGEGLAAEIELKDRMQRVADARLEEDFEIAPGTNWATAIQSLINAGVPGLKYRFCSTPHASATTVVPAESDRAEQALRMAKAIGCRLFFDGLGELVMVPEPNFDDATPVWTLSDGEGGLLSATRLELDREKAYNRTIAYGQHPSLAGSVPRGAATDDDPQSPTYYYGPFGQKPRFYASEFITTDAQAAQAAKAIQASESGIARGLTIEFVPNYALEPLDPVQIRWSPLGIDELHVLPAFTLPLVPKAAKA